MMDSVVYEYLLTSLIICPMLKPFLYATSLLITHFLSVDVGYIIVYVLELAVLYCKQFRNCPLEILKWKFEGSGVYISFFFGFLVYILCLSTHHNDLAKCMSERCVL